MARAKCQWCKKDLDTKTAHREVVDGKNNCSRCGAKMDLENEL